MPPNAVVLQADDDDDNENEEKEARPLYRRPMVWFHLVAYFLSACLLFVGLGSQFIPAMFVVSLYRGSCCSTL